uniref:Uncharacterized protein n=1 Tax=Ursus maritimus TaxID=29073 RepID=A0A452T2B3_URSMA
MRLLAPQPDHVAIVTGGTDGIGYSTVKHLARLGMHVIIGSQRCEDFHSCVFLTSATLNFFKLEIMLAKPRTL